MVQTPVPAQGPAAWELKEEGGKGRREKQTEESGLDAREGSINDFQGPC